MGEITLNSIFETILTRSIVLSQRKVIKCNSLFSELKCVEIETIDDDKL
jgi:hypothetical protein